MPRTGRHPLKEKDLALELPAAQDVTVTTITHIPMLEGYWQHSLEVLRLCFGSLRASTQTPFDLMVFDNASCREVTDYLSGLKEEGLIQYLILSDQNFRKLGALDFLLRAAPGEFVAYADSDVYFLTGWLERSLEVMRAFPQAGMVSALPTVDKSDRFVASTLAGIASDSMVAVEKGPGLVPSAFIRAHQLSLGKDPAPLLSAERTDTRLTRDGVRAFLSAQDFQFLTRREVISRVLPLDTTDEELTYDPIYSPVFEAKVDRAGFWRLSTADYLVHHMGNSVPDLQSELAEIAPGLNFSQVVSSPAPAKKGGGLWQSHWLRKVLKRLHTWSYRKLFE